MCAGIQEVWNLPELVFERKCSLTLEIVITKLQDSSRAELIFSMILLAQDVA